jgi:hypothetical protein
MLADHIPYITKTAQSFVSPMAVSRNVGSAITSFTGNIYHNNNAIILPATN